MRRLGSFDPKIGEYYLVKSVKTEKVDYWLPVIGSIHSDDADSLYNQHLHVDDRFLSNELYDKWHYPASEYMFKVINLGREKLRLKYKLKYKPWKCRRYWPKRPGHTLSNTIGNIKGKVLDLNCKICPHKGYNLTHTKAVNGVITCPLHNVQWSAKTGELLSY